MKIMNSIKVAAVLTTALFIFAGSATAEIFRYRTGGPWEDVSDGETNGWGVNPASPGIRVPEIGDEARINWGFSTVTLDYEAPAFDNLKIGVDESGVLEINDGGILTVDDANIGHNGPVDGIVDIFDGGVMNVTNNLFMGRVDATTRGFINIEQGGVMNVGNHLWLGGTGEAEVVINGGTLNQTGGILGLGSTDFNLPGGTASITVNNDGVLNLNNIHAGGTQLSIQPGSKIDVTGTGRVTLPGNFVAVLEGYRDANLLFGNGVAGAVDITVESIAGGAGDFDGDDDVDGQDFLFWQRDQNAGDLANDWLPNYGGGAAEITVVTAAAPAFAAASVPEPGSLALAVLGAIALCGSRRGR